MSYNSIDVIECDGDGCDSREIVDAHEGKPKFSRLVNGWIEIQHRDKDDHLGIMTTHYCPDCAVEYVLGDRVRPTE